MQVGELSQHSAKRNVWFETGYTVGDRDPAHYRDAAHRAQPAQK